MDKNLNYIFLFLLVVIFTLLANAGDHQQILLALVLSAGILIPALLMNWITSDGYSAGVVFGTVTFGLGGWFMAALVLLFFVSGSVLARDRERHMRQMADDLQPHKKPERRNGLQVWANGFWMVFFIVCWYLSGLALFYVAAAASIATATADTWATEIGHRAGVETFLITDLSRVPPGTEGGVSLNGLLGAMAGSLLIGLSWLLLQHSLHIEIFFVIVISGFAGCLIDSLLGALYQNGSRRRNQKRFLRYFAAPDKANSLVNWTATGVGGVIAILLNLVF